MTNRTFLMALILLGAVATHAWAARAVKISITVDNKVVASNVINGVDGDDPWYYAGRYYKAKDKAILTADKDTVTLKGKISIAWKWSGKGNTMTVDQLTLTRAKEGPKRGNNSNGFYAIRKGDTMWIISKDEIERLKKAVKK